MDIQGISMGIGNAKVATRKKKDGCMTARRIYSRTGLHALKARVKVRGLAAIDMRTAARLRRSLLGGMNYWPTWVGKGMSPPSDSL